MLARDHGVRGAFGHDGTQDQRTGGDDIGATRVHLRLIDLTDLDHLELIASEVLPQVGG